MAIDLETADRLIEFLDGLAKIDPEAMGRLVAARVPCGRDLSLHPSVQVGKRDLDDYLNAPDPKDRNRWVVGLVGVLNGFVGACGHGWGPIAAIIESDGRCTGFALSPHAEHS